MKRVAVRVLHAEAAADAGPLERDLATVRAGLAERLVATFRRAGATDAAVLAGPPDDTPFGRRLRELVAVNRPDGIVVAGSGAMALARPDDLRPFLDAAAADEPLALANNRYSADAVAVACAERLLDVPDLPADNALPRWLAESAGYRVVALARRRRLQLDVDGPLDATLLGIPWPDPGALVRVRAALTRLRAVAADPRRELIVTGRTSAASVRWLEQRAAARVRVLVEERGLRAGARTNPRAPSSVLGLLLDHEGPGRLGAVLARLGDAALVDTRVLLAHRLGADETAWPRAEDRFASDLLLHERIADPWLADLTQAAADAPIPVVLGSHTVVGPGLPLSLRSR